jgi:hypothetical protein
VRSCRDPGIRGRRRTSHPAPPSALGPRAAYGNSMGSSAAVHRRSRRRRASPVIVGRGHSPSSATTTDNGRSPNCGTARPLSRSGATPASASGRCRVRGRHRLDLRVARHGGRQPPQLSTRALDGAWSRSGAYRRARCRAAVRAHGLRNTEIRPRHLNRTSGAVATALSLPSSHLASKPATPRNWRPIASDTCGGWLTTTSAALARSGRSGRRRSASPETLIVTSGGPSGTSTCSDRNPRGSREPWCSSGTT